MDWWWVARRSRCKERACSPMGHSIASSGDPKRVQGGERKAPSAPAGAYPCPGGDWRADSGANWDLPSQGALTLFFRWRKKSVQKKASGTATPGKSPLLPILAAGLAMSRAAELASLRMLSCALGARLFPPSKWAIKGFFPAGERSEPRTRTAPKGLPQDEAWAERERVPSGHNCRRQLATDRPEQIQGPGTAVPGTPIFANYAKRGGPPLESPCRWLSFAHFSFATERKV